MCATGSAHLRPRKRGSFQGAALFLSALSLPLGCATPPFLGFQLQDPPEGFLFDPDAAQSVTVFPDREILSQGAWWRITDTERQASIYLTRFRGPATLEDVERARDRYAASLSGSAGEASQLQFLRIDGQEAWGWEERIEAEGAPPASAFRAVVLYDTMAVSIEFHSDIPEWMDPAAQREVISSFGFGEARILWGWIVAVLVLLTVLAGAFLRNVSRKGDRPYGPSDYELASIRPDRQDNTIVEPPE